MHTLNHSWSIVAARAIAKLDQTEEVVFVMSRRQMDGSPTCEIANSERVSC